MNTKKSIMRFCALLTILLIVLSQQSALAAPTTLVTIKAGKGGKIVTGESGRYSFRTKLHLVAEADSGYRFSHWSATGGAGNFGSKYQPITTFTVPNYTTTVTANFVEETKQISATPSTLDFGIQKQGFTPVGQTVTIQNITNSSVTLKTAYQPQNFQLQYSTTLLRRGETATVTVIPKAGLPAGTYDTTFYIMTSQRVETGAPITVTLTVTPLVPPAITTDSLPEGMVGEEYRQTLTATGDPTIVWSVSAGSLPDGPSLAADGTISGTPQKEGYFVFTLKADNGTAPTATKQLYIRVPPVVKPVIPQTGDGTPIELLSMATILSAGLFLCLGMKRKREE